MIDDSSAFIEEESHYNEKYKSSENLEWRYDILFSAAHKQFNDWVISIIKEDQPIKILDLGCGDGSRTRFLGDYPNVELIGIDISEAGIKKANENKVGNCSYIIMAAENMDFAPNSFDLIINYGSFSSINLESVWKKLLNIIRPEGSIIGIETLGNNPLFNFKRNINVKNRIRSQTSKERILKYNQVFNWSNNCDKFTSRTFGFMSPLLVPLLWIIPKKNLLRDVVYIFDKIDKYFWFKFQFFRKLSFKIVFHLQGFK